MKRSIDGRTLPCPQPVIKVKKAFDEGGFNQLEVLVDNIAAVENITRFVENSGHTILSITEEEKIHTIIIDNDDEETGLEVEPAVIEQSGNSGTSNIFITSMTIGKGDRTLGAKLMEAFLFSLTELEIKPRHILMMNEGVKNAVEGGPSIENLRDLEDSGVSILVCGACLDFYGIKNQLQVGKISNMYEISSILTGKENTVSIC